MTGKKFWLLLAGVAAAHAAVFFCLAGLPMREKSTPRRPSSNFESAEKTFRDPVSGETLVVRQYTVSTKMEDRPPGELGSVVKE